MRLEPSQGRFSVSNSTRRSVHVAIAIDAPSRSVELYRRFYETCKVEDEKDERAENDDAREKLALQNEAEEDEDEDKGDNASGNGVGK